ncbi:MAG: urea ABC transporter ATP-binding subunit UrtE [Candidatus Nanopelagicales bacterium]
MLEIRDLHVGYGRTTVLHGVSLSTSDEGVTSVLGHNGAGKSTLLRAVMGLLKPRAGSVLFDGKDITRMQPHDRVRMGIAYVPQGQQSFPYLTTGENLQLVADGRKDGKAAIADVLDLFPALTELLDRRAGLLSGGQRQQLALARALITGPKLLLLDEPTEGIQPSVVQEIEEKIMRLSQSGIDVLLVEQHIGFALRAASTYAVIESGEIVRAGAVEPGADEIIRTAMAV